MANIARWCFGHRRWVIGGWLVVLVVVVFAHASVGSSYNSNTSLPGTDAQAASDLLTKNFPAASGENDQVVFQTSGGTSIRSASVESSVNATLTRVSKVPRVVGVASPYTAKDASQISRDGTVAFATVTWKQKSNKVTTSEAKNLVRAATAGSSANVHVSLGGSAIESEESSGPGVSEAVGIVAALIILLIVFGGALVSALMPLVTAIVALGIGVSAIGLLSHVMSVADISTNLAILIGLGVGVDYGLFMVSRYRTEVKHGMSREDAVARAAVTSGRTVLFAGATVCIALLGQLALGVAFLYGVSLSAALTVALTMAASLTFLPAMLAVIGPKVLSRRERARLATGAAIVDGSPFWLSLANVVHGHRRIVALGSLALVLVCAVPIFGLRLGSSDANTDASGTTTHQAYEALSKGFGQGYNGPLELAGQVSSSSDVTRFDNYITRVSHEKGVASVTTPVRSPNGQAVLANVYPTTSPQSKATVSLVSRIRDQIPQVDRGSGLTVHVGGETATNIDFARVLEQKLPVFIALVVVLAFILLMAVFRSVLVPLVAAIMNLLSIGAALGALNAVFNWGWGKSILGLSGTGPIAPFLPVLMFSVLFGLSMDYEVFLVSRMQEEWRRLIRSQPGGVRGRRAQLNDDAILSGQSKSGRIIAAAAGIMICVFGSFLLNNDVILKEFGFGLAFSVFIDAFVIRTFLVPATMHLIGPANWWLPDWLDRILPHLTVDPAEETFGPRDPELPSGRSSATGTPTISHR